MEFCIHDTGTVLKIPFILDMNLAKANCTEDRVCMSCIKVVLGVTQTEKKIEEYRMCYNHIFRTTLISHETLYRFIMRSNEQEKSLIKRYKLLFH